MFPSERRRRARKAAKYKLRHADEIKARQRAAQHRYYWDVVQPRKAAAKLAAKAALTRAINAELELSHHPKWHSEGIPVLPTDSPAWGHCILCGIDLLPTDLVTALPLCGRCNDRLEPGRDDSPHAHAMACPDRTPGQPGSGRIRYKPRH